MTDAIQADAGEADRLAVLALLLLATTALHTAAPDAAGEGGDSVGAQLTRVWNAAIAAGGL